MARMKPEHWMHALDAMEADLLERIADEDGEMPPSSKEPDDAENTGHLESEVHGEPDGDEGGIMIVIGGKPMMQDDEELKRRLGR